MTANELSTICRHMWTANRNKLLTIASRLITILTADLKERAAHHTPEPQTSAVAVAVPQCVCQLQDTLRRDPELHIELAVDCPSKYASVTEKALLTAAEKVLVWASQLPTATQPAMVLEADGRDKDAMRDLSARCREQLAEVRRQHEQELVVKTDPLLVGEVPEWLKAVSSNLRIQDNRITKHPLFVVQQRHRQLGFDPAYVLMDDEIAWGDNCNDNEPAFKGEPEWAEAEAHYQEHGDEPNGWTRTGYKNEWQFVTACFTEQGCKDYIEANGHNLNEPRIYAESAHRNLEWQRLRELLLQVGEEGDEDL